MPTARSLKIHGCTDLSVQTSHRTVTHFFDVSGKVHAARVDSFIRDGIPSCQWFKFHPPKIRIADTQPIWYVLSSERSALETPGQHHRFCFVFPGRAVPGVVSVWHCTVHDNMDWHTALVTTPPGNPPRPWISLLYLGPAATVIRAEGLRYQKGHRKSLGHQGIQNFCLPSFFRIVNAKGIHTVG
jgi:hypothetical protein